MEITGEQRITLGYQDPNYDAVTYAKGCLLQNPSIGAPAAVPNTEGCYLAPQSLHFSQMAKLSCRNKAHSFPADREELRDQLCGSDSPCKVSLLV